MIVKTIRSLRDRFRTKKKTGKDRKAVSETREKKQEYSEIKPPKQPRHKEKAPASAGKNDLPRKGHQVKKDSSPPHKKQRAKAPWKLSDFDVPALEGYTRFHDLGLSDPLMRAIADLGFKYCTPIQAEILPSTLR